MKPEDFFRPRIEKVDSKTLRSCSTLISLELARRVQEDEPEAAGCLIEAAKHATDAFFDLFAMEPYRFKSALKERTNCPVPMPANPLARDKVLQLMEKNTAINLSQTWPFDPYNPTNQLLLKHFHEIRHQRLLLGSIHKIKPRYRFTEAEKEWIALKPLSKTTCKEWFRAIWKKIKSETNNQPQNDEKYRVFGATNAAIQDHLRKYFTRNFPSLHI